MKRLICISPESAYYYKTPLNGLQKDPRVAQLFNTDLSYLQLYLFTRLKVEPTCKVQVQYDTGSRLTGLTKLDEFEVKPPPFSVLYFKVTTSSSPYSLDSHDNSDPIREINARYQEGSEEKILEDFCKYVLVKDPDIIVSPKRYRSKGVLRYLFARIEVLGIEACVIHFCNEGDNTLLDEKLEQLRLLDTAMGYLRM